MNLRTAPKMLKVSITNFICFFFSLELDIVAELALFKLLFVVYDKKDGPLTSEEEEQRAIAKLKMLGNIKFIGELGKLDLIHESILHKCIKTVSRTCYIFLFFLFYGNIWYSDIFLTLFFFFLNSLKLLEKKKRIQLKDMGEDLECLCQIMRTVGPRLDHEKAKVTGLDLRNVGTTTEFSNY